MKGYRFVTAATEVRMNYGAVLSPLVEGGCGLKEEAVNVVFGRMETL